jgi:hypothetical protein
VSLLEDVPGGLADAFWSSIQQLTQTKEEVNDEVVIGSKNQGVR